MKFMKLIELFDFMPKSKRKASSGLDDGRYVFYTSSNKLTKFSNEFDYSGESLIFGTGGSASVHYQTDKFSASTDCFVVKPKNADIFAQYYYYYFANNLNILQSGFRGAGLKHITKPFISNIILPVPTVEEQRKIAGLLSRLDQVIGKRKEGLKDLDRLLKCQYLKWFSPSNRDYENWEIDTIEGLSAKKKGAMRTGPFGSNLLHSEFSKTGDVAVIGIDNAVNNRFEWGEPRFITNAKYKELEAYTLFPNDVIITIMGTIGRSAVIPKDIPLAINSKHLAAITLDPQRINPYFLSYSIYSDVHIMKQIIRKTHGAIMKGLNLNIIKSIEVHIPPMQLQNQFAYLINKISSAKMKYEQHLFELEILFEATSSKAFSSKLATSKIILNKEHVSLQIENQFDATEKQYTFDALMQAILSFKSPFSFEELYNDLRKQNFVDLPEYIVIKDMIYEMLKHSPPNLTQVFTDQRVKLKVN